MAKLFIASDLAQRFLVKLKAPSKLDKYLNKDAIASLECIIPQIHDVEKQDKDTTWLKLVKSLLYDLEDLFEEIDIIGPDQEINMQTPKGKKPTSLLHNLSFCTSTYGKTMEKRLKRSIKDDFMEKLASMKKFASHGNVNNDNNKDIYGFDDMSIKEERQISFGEEEMIIGREEDKNEIKKLLRSTNDSFVQILGIEGIGKTTITQIVFNDKEVRSDFELMGWVCVSGLLSLRELKMKILKSIINNDCMSLQEAIYSKKYLLVLDGVEIRDNNLSDWKELINLLSCGGQESKVVVITRAPTKVNEEALGIIIKSYEVKELSYEQSKELFWNLAYKHIQDQQSDQYKSIGDEILKKCSGIPLAIRSITGLLFFKDKLEDWECLKNDLQTLVISDDIMPILKICYNHLPPLLKQCFAYCSLFPKDFEFNKMDLIHLWMAQRFIIRPSEQNQKSLLYLGHWYFLELLKRSFLQYVGRDKYGDVTKCKMHSLMNDLAQLVAKEECVLLHGNDEPPKDVDTNMIRHVSFIIDSSWEVPSWVFKSTRLRSFLILSSELFPNVSVKNMNGKSLGLSHIRAMDLAKVDCDIFKSTIEETKHLRYLRLGGSLKSFSECIKKLQYLDTLDLRACSDDNVPQLCFDQCTRLRCLRIRGVSDNWIKMPSLSQRTTLEELDVLIAGKDNNLKVLSNLNNLCEEFEIHFNRYHLFKEPLNEKILANMKLKNLVLQWSSSYHGYEGANLDKLLEDLKPPSSLKTLVVTRWMGKTFPSWSIKENPNHFLSLSSVEINGCDNFKHLPHFNLLPNLKSLELKNLKSLEYIENNGDVNEATLATNNFPSLKYLHLWKLPKLQGWSKVNDQDQQLKPQLLTIPDLELIIIDCKELKSLPLFWGLQSLHVHQVHKKLLKHFLHQYIYQHQHPIV